MKKKSPSGSFPDLEIDVPPFVMTILDRLDASGCQAYIVGGAVRDSCLHRPVADWDVTTNAPPEKIKSIFIDIRKFNLKHDTVTLVDASRHYEVTTFRGPVNFVHTIEADLGHRDFTINAMAYSAKEKKMLDPYRGKADILRKLVRAVGEPEDRFKEDPIRLIRAVRLATELGFKIETKTLKTISTMGGQLGSVAQERIREELMKILMSRRPSRGFNLMLRTGLLNHFIPELLEGYLKRQNAYHRYTIYKHIMETIDNVQSDPVLRLTALLHDIAKPRVREKINGEFRFFGHEKVSARLAGEIMGRLKFSNAMIGRVTDLVKHHMLSIGYDSGWSDGAVRRLIRRVGSDNMEQLLSFRRADLLAHGIKDRKLALLSELEKRVETLSQRPIVAKARDLALDGHTVMEILGLAQSPQVGKILKELMDKVTDHPELNTKGGLTALLYEMKPNNPSSRKPAPHQKKIKASV